MLAERNISTKRGAQYDLMHNNKKKTGYSNKFNLKLTKLIYEFSISSDLKKIYKNTFESNLSGNELFQQH